MLSPKELVNAWVHAFNQGDADAVAAFYATNATNHQVANEPVVGKEAIREMFHQEFNNPKMMCIIENIFEDGSWAILEWRDPKNVRGCGFFRIEDGKIAFQRGYWDKLSFLRANGLPLPRE